MSLIVQLASQSAISNYKVSIDVQTMTQTTYINGRYLPHAQAQVHVCDRGFLFGDGIYEVVQVIGERIIDLPEHLTRLRRSLAEIQLPFSMSDAALTHILHEVRRRNRLTYGAIYWQITRGTAKRDFGFPKNTVPSLMVMVIKLKPLTDAFIQQGVAVNSIADQRWKRCDIKSIALLAPVLGKQQAKDKGFFDAWQLDDNGYVTEGTSNNAWIVTNASELVTRPADAAILNGVTRLRLIKLAEELDIPVVERAFTLSEAKQAAEAFLSSTSLFVLPITRIDDTVIGTGRAGAVSLRLRDAYKQYIGYLC